MRDRLSATSIRGKGALKYHFDKLTNMNDKVAHYICSTHDLFSFQNEIGAASVHDLQELVHRHFV